MKFYKFRMNVIYKDSEFFKAMKNNVMKYIQNREVCTNVR